MAFSINQVYLVGNISSDIELRYTPNGNAVCNFSMATNRSVKQGEEWQDVPTFHRVVAWGKTAEWLSQNVAKGTKVVVTGRIDNSTYEDKEGNKRYKSEIVAQDIIPMVARDPNRTAPTKPEAPKEENDEVNLDDIPDDFDKPDETKKDGEGDDDIPF